MIAYDMQRNFKTVAQVVALDSGKCIVSWPTSVVVYDSEDAARAVHIQHMGGRGESTHFDPVMGSGPSFSHGMTNAAVDWMEGCIFASVTDNYNSDVPVPISADVDADSYIAGYVAYARSREGKPWRDQMAEMIAAQREARKQKSPR